MRARMRGQALATAALGVAVLVRWLLDPWLGESLPFVTAFGAVAAAVWAAGWVPASFVAIIGYFAFSYFFIAPRHTLAFGTFAHVVGMLAYLLSCGLIIGIGEAMRAARVRRDRLSATVATQRRDAHEKAEELPDARQLASIVEYSGDAIIGKSLDGTIQSWNDAAERVFGYTAAEAVGRNISLVIPPERLAEENQIITTLKAGQRIDHFETERVRKDGRRILVSLTVSPIKDDEGNIVGCSKVVRDVTRQRRDDERERRLLADAAAANAKFQAFFEQGALLAVIMELDGTIVAANRLSWEGCGYRREQILRQAVLGRSLVGVLARAARGRSRRRPRRRSPARRSVARRLTSSPTAASGPRTSRSCRSRTRRERCCSWPRRASTSPTASAPRPIGRSS